MVYDVIWMSDREKVDWNGARRLQVQDYAVKGYTYRDISILEVAHGPWTCDCMSVSAVPAVDHTSELVDDDCFDVELLLHVCIPLDGLVTAGCVNGKSRIALL